MVRDENITPNGRDYDQIFDTYATADVDFYVDLTDIYGGQLIPNLGAGTVDAYGKGYDVMTSAQVDLFGNDPNLRVYYDGKHTTFKIQAISLIHLILENGQWFKVIHPMEETGLSSESCKSSRWRRFFFYRCW